VLPAKVHTSSRQATWQTPLVEPLAHEIQSEGFVTAMAELRDQKQPKSKIATARKALQSANYRSSSAQALHYLFRNQKAS